MKKLFTAFLNVAKKLWFVITKQDSPPGTTENKDSKVESPDTTQGNDDATSEPTLQKNTSYTDPDCTSGTSDNISHSGTKSNREFTTVSGSEVTEEQTTEPPISESDYQRVGGEPEVYDKVSLNTGSQTNTASENTSQRNNTVDTKGRNQDRKPRDILGRRNKERSNPSPNPQQTQVTHPELVYRMTPDSATREVVLVADKEFLLEAVIQNKVNLNSSDQECVIPSLHESLEVRYGNGQRRKYLLVCDKPLIFKLKKNWTGQGRSATQVTTGHFIVLAPANWKRKGQIPVEPHVCNDTKFRAHYFYRDNDSPDDGSFGFLEYDLSPCSGIELTGKRIFDDSDEGDLFVGDPPCLILETDVPWARVGVEAKNGWGRTFSPKDESLPDVLNGREGRFFLRIYGSDARMLDSTDFRYLRNLKQILMNDAPYLQEHVLMPKPTGYTDTMIRFDGIRDISILQKLSDETLETEVQKSVVAIPPTPDADRQSYLLKSKSESVKVVLQLPRIWWRIAKYGSHPGKWVDTPIVMTREEFRGYAHSKNVLHVLSKRFKSVSVGFDEGASQLYRRKLAEDTITIPLVHFADYEEIRERRYVDVSFNVILAGKTLPLIRIAADSYPKITSFKSEPTTIYAGQKVILSWATKYAEHTRISINPSIGTVESDGSCTVEPTNTTTYTLTLSGFTFCDQKRTITVTVLPASGDLVALVSRGGRGWRVGKGFSCTELANAGLTLHQATERSMPTDKRRQSSHPTNIVAIRRFLNV